MSDRVAKLVNEAIECFRNTTGKNPIFCYDCANHLDTVPIECSFVVEIKITPIGIEHIKATPEVSNKHNNCEFYVQGWEK